jgi:diacylglycerol kinase (ATP)
MNSPYKNKTGITRILSAFKNSAYGLKNTFKNEESFRQELILTVILTPLAICIGDNHIERIFLITSLILLLIVELINTAIEIVVDRVSYEKNDLSKLAKDIGSAAVLIAFLYCFIVWFFILFS